MTIEDCVYSIKVNDGNSLRLAAMAGDRVSTDMTGCSSGAAITPHPNRRSTARLSVGQFIRIICVSSASSYCEVIGKTMF
jgi:hypothetical protein